MKPIRIFVLSNQLLFARGLESLLDEDDKLRIVGQETDVDQATDQIKAVQPDIVIIDSTNSSESQRAELIHILQQNPEIKVITLSLQDNSLYIYQAAQRVVNNVTDLMEAIKHDSSYMVEYEETS